MQLTLFCDKNEQLRIALNIIPKGLLSSTSDNTGISQKKSSSIKPAIMQKLREFDGRNTLPISIR